MSEQKKLEEKLLWGEPEELWKLYRRSSMLTGRRREPEEDETPEKPETKAAGGGVQKAYSLWWLFAAYSLPKPEDAPLVHAFLGNEAAQQSLREAYDKRERVKCDPEDYIGRAPNEQQWKAIETAIESPISFIQGPPGTGKTATIINLIYQLAKRGKTVAVVSSNNAALENIHKKLEEEQEESAGTPEQREKAAALALRVAKLGGMKNRKTFYKGREAMFPDRHAERYYYLQEKKDAPVRKEEREKWLNDQEPDLEKRIGKRLEADPLDEAARGWLTEMEASKAEGGKGRRGLLEKGWLIVNSDGTLQSVTREQGVKAQDFFRAELSSEDDRARWGFPLPGFAAFTSTVNSLPNCFEDGLFHQYDYVIVDEASQMSLPAGLLVMCHAKHLVLVGDEQQLAPVVDERAMALLDEEDEEDKEEGMDPEERAVCDAIAYESDPDSYDEYDEEEWRQWEEEDRLNQEWYDIARWGNYRPRPEVSFLDLCLDVFLGKMKGDARRGGLLPGPAEEQPKVFLSQHYRCHPGIIEFCNETVYAPAGTPLECCTISYDEDIQIPIRVLQFEGDYCESCYYVSSNSKGEKKPDKKEPDGEETLEEARWKELEATWAAEGEPIPPLSRPGRPSKRNLRQVEIFMEVEWPELLERLEGEEPFSVCILSPFRGQLRALEEAIRRYGCDIAEGKETSAKEDVDLLSLAFDNTSGKKDKDEKKQASALTIHKSQGQEFDVVYLLPVEDGAWEWPFSQKKRMINVAVSRAKKELRIITSRKYMDREVPTDDARKAEDEMYLKKLVEYVEQNATGEDADKGFGIQKTAMVSLFDAKEPRPEEKVSAGQRLVEAALAEMAPRLGFSWTGEDGVDREVPVKRVLEELEGPDFRTDSRYREFLDYIEYASFDCVIRDPDGKPALAIEVDGAYHRYPWRDREKDKDTSPDALYLRWRDRWRKDRVKDQIVKLAGGAVYYGNRKDLVRMVDKKRQVIHQWDRGENWGTFALLRLNDDGSTFLETEVLRAGAPKELADKVFTIQDLIRRYLPRDEDAPSLSTVLSAWSESEVEWLRARFPGKGNLASRIQPRLKELGLLEHTDAGWQVTADGYALGIRMYNNKEKKATYPVYPPRAQQELRRLLLEGME